MKLVIIESPYSGNIEENLLYLLACIRDSVCRGESPYASHLMMPGALNDSDINERELGIKCGYAWWRAASLIVFYTDLGWSPGMIRAFVRARTHGIPLEERSIEDNTHRGDSARGALA